MTIIPLQSPNIAQGEWIPSTGQWPVDPQEDVPVSENRIWVDGCFDFSHHGVFYNSASPVHLSIYTNFVVTRSCRRNAAGSSIGHRAPSRRSLRRSHPRKQGAHRYALGRAVGHDIFFPLYLRWLIQRRITAVEACRWATRAVPKAPYVTSLPWISHYGCQYVVHGDDITSDSSGQDCYRFVKQAGRFKVVKRTPGISTTDLVGRMLLCTKNHFIQSLEKVLAGEQGAGGEEERRATGKAMLQRIQDYATDSTGLAPGCDVWFWHASRPAKLRRTTQSSTAERRPSTGERSHSHYHHAVKEEKGKFEQLVQGKGPREDQVVIYVDGGWDLFSSGHIEFLRIVTETEEKAAKERGWYTEEASQARIDKAGEDYGPVFLVAGIHEDEVINTWKGINYPIMNIFERGLCVLQCKVRTIHRFRRLF